MEGMVMNAPSKIEAASLHTAMAAAFGEIEAATKSANNPHFKTKYADIGAVIDAIKPALIRHGLFFTQHPQPSEDGVTVETVLHHASGESLSLGSLYLPANKRDAQGFGSALTYARRYALQTAFGVPTEDDDGNAAVKAAAGYSQGGAISQQQPNTISDEQIVRLQSLIQATSSNVQAFCQRLKVDALNRLPAERFADALELLETKLANMAKAETAAKAKESA
jgi:hypothetical protein